MTDHRIDRRPLNRMLGAALAVTVATTSACGGGDGDDTDAADSSSAPMTDTAAGSDTTPVTGGGGDTPATSPPGSTGGVDTTDGESGDGPSDDDGSDAAGDGADLVETARQSICPDLLSVVQGYDPTAVDQDFFFGCSVDGDVVSVQVTFVPAVDVPETCDAVTAGEVPPGFSISETETLETPVGPGLISTDGTFAFACDGVLVVSSETTVTGSVGVEERFPPREISERVIEAATTS